MYVDDLKTYHKSYNKAALMARTLKDKFEDIGLYWGLEKCATMNVVRGKIEQSTKVNLMHTQINLYLSFSSSIFWWRHFPAKNAKISKTNSIGC